MKVLCVNDNVVTLTRTTQIIERSGIAEEVFIASNIRDALTHYSRPAKTEYPKMIFIDRHMHEQSVWDFLDNFTKSYLPFYPDTKVIITSYTLDPDDSEKAKQYACVADFIHYY